MIRHKRSSSESSLTSQLDPRNSSNISFSVLNSSSAKSRIAASSLADPFSRKAPASNYSAGSGRPGPPRSRSQGSREDSASRHSRLANPERTALYNLYISSKRPVPGNQGPASQSISSFLESDDRIQAVKGLIERNFSKEISLPELYWQNPESFTNSSAAGNDLKAKKKPEKTLETILSTFDESHKIFKKHRNFNSDRVLLACDFPVRVTPKRTLFDENYNVQNLVRNLSKKNAEKVEHAIDYNITLNEFQRYLDKSREVIKKSMDTSNRPVPSKQMRLQSGKQKITKFLHVVHKKANVLEEKINSGLDT